MNRTWPFLLVTIALVGSLTWGYSQYRGRQQTALQYENNYQMTFHKLAWNVENLEDRLARLLATGSHRRTLKELEGVRMYSNAAVDNMAQLPLYTLPMTKTTEFVSGLRDLSERLTDKLADGGTLTDDEWNQMKGFYQNAAVLDREIAGVAELISAGRLRWTDAERLTRANRDGKDGNPLTAALTGADGQLQPVNAAAAPGAGNQPANPGNSVQPPPVGGAPSAGSDEPAGGAGGAAGTTPRGSGATGAVRPGAAVIPEDADKPPKTDLGAPISPEQALQKVTEFFAPEGGLKDPPKITGQREGRFPLYFVNASKASGVPVNAAVSKKGGKFIWYLDGRAIKGAKLTKEQVVDRARKVLETQKFPAMQFVSYEDYQGVGVATFAPVQNGVTLYTDQVLVRIARDNGELLGFEATDFYQNHHKRQLAPPKMTVEQARAKVNKHLKIAEQKQAIVKNDDGKEVMAYEFVGRVDGDRFRVFIDGNSGDEALVIRVEEPTQ